MLEVPFKENFGDRYTIGGLDVQSLYNGLIFLDSGLAYHQFQKNNGLHRKTHFWGYSMGETKLWSLGVEVPIRRELWGQVHWRQTNTIYCCLKSHFWSIQCEGSHYVIWDLEVPFKVRELWGQVHCKQTNSMNYRSTMTLSVNWSQCHRYHKFQQ